MCMCVVFFISLTLFENETDFNQIKNNQQHGSHNILHIENANQSNEAVNNWNDVFIYTDSPHFLFFPSTVWSDETVSQLTLFEHTQANAMPVIPFNETAHRFRAS